MDQVFSVMILDDEPIVCERLRSTLEKVNLDIETFTHTNEAIKRFAEKKISGFSHRLKDERVGRHRGFKTRSEGFPRNQSDYHYGVCHRRKGQGSPKIGAHDLLPNRLNSVNCGIWS